MPSPPPPPAPGDRPRQAAALCNPLARFSVLWGPYPDWGCPSGLFSPAPSLGVPCGVPAAPSPHWLPAHLAHASVPLPAPSPTRRPSSEAVWWVPRRRSPARFSRSAWSAGVPAAGAQNGPRGPSELRAHAAFAVSLRALCPSLPHFYEALGCRPEARCSLAPWLWDASPEIPPVCVPVPAAGRVPPVRGAPARVRQGESGAGNSESG